MKEISLAQNIELVFVLNHHMENVSTITAEMRTKSGKYKSVNYKRKGK